MRLVEAIVTANHAAAEGRREAAQFPLPAEALPLAALTCLDPRLNKFFPGALGLKEEQFIWLRNAGNVITSPMSSTVRSVALAICLKGAKEIAVIGHTDCAMGKLTTAELLDRLQAVGVIRSALPIPNLHEFFGLFSSERPNVIRAVGFLRTSPVLPPKMPIHGLLIDTVTGRLDWVVNGYESSGLPLDTQGAPEDVAHHVSYSAGPVKLLGSQTVPLAAPGNSVPGIAAPEWKPQMPKIGAPVSSPVKPTPPPLPKPAPTPPGKQPPPPPQPNVVWRLRGR